MIRRLQQVLILRGSSLVFEELSSMIVATLTVSAEMLWLYGTLAA